MKPIAHRDPFKLGVATLVVLVVLGGLIVAFSRLSPGSSTYTAVLAQSAGLRPSEEVQIAGVNVGQVKSVSVVGNTVHATFTVKNSVHMGPQSTAAVQVATLLGSHQLQVKPRGAGDLPDDTIPLSNTSVPFNLQDVLNQGTHRLEQLNGKTISRLLETMSNTLQGNTGEFRPALIGVARLSNVIAGRSNQFGALMKAARSVTGQLSASSGDIIGLMKQTNLVMSEVTARREAIHKLLTEATTLSQNVNLLIGHTKADIHPALTALNAALAELRHQDGTLKHVLHVMAPAVRYLANATGNGPYINLNNPPQGLLPPNDGCGGIFRLVCK